MNKTKISILEKGVMPLMRTYKFIYFNIEGDTLKLNDKFIDIYANVPLSLALGKTRVDHKITFLQHLGELQFT